MRSLGLTIRMNIGWGILSPVSFFDERLWNCEKVLMQVVWPFSALHFPSNFGGLGTCCLCLLVLRRPFCVLGAREAPSALSAETASSGLNVPSSWDVMVDNVSLSLAVYCVAFDRRTATTTTAIFHEIYVGSRSSSKNTLLPNSTIVTLNSSRSHRMRSYSIMVAWWL